MKEGFFSGSYGGNNGKIAPDTKLECKICWYVYDPAKGDEYWHIDPGTPFSNLPDQWRCPNCDGDRDDFMVVDS